MMLSKNFGLTLAIALAFCAMSIPARAQGTREGKIVKAHFEVLHMLYNAIQVRSVVDMREIHTFVYSDRIRDEMQSLFIQGGYQYGDKVKIWYQPGTEIALKIKGKPSKPQ
ncbi:MAG: hypothetical protein ABSA96_10205 [Candidatus Acidiferrales bacterium]|jgi:hypothetical protein